MVSAFVLILGYLPLLIGYITTEDIGLKVTAGLIGVIVAAIATIITLYKLQENWIEYCTIGLIS